MERVCQFAFVRLWAMSLQTSMALSLMLGLSLSLVAQAPPETPVVSTSDSAAQSEAKPQADTPPTAEPNEQATLPPPEKLSFELHIRPILDNKCSECHGIKQAKADLRVDDREAMLSYIVPGDLESSSLWSDYLITTDSELRMPPAKSGKQLSALELAAIRAWIQEGAEWPEVPAAVVQQEETPHRQFKNNWERSLHFLGFFHPAIVHFPIALLIVSSLFAVLSLFRRPNFESAAYYCLWLGALGAVLGSMAGWTFADIRGYPDFWSTTWSEDGIARHRNTGIATAAFAILICLVATVARGQQRSKLRSVWLLGTVILAGLVSIVGHQGGELTYGENLMDRAYHQSFGAQPLASDLIHTHETSTSSDGGSTARDTKPRSK